MNAKELIIEYRKTKDPEIIYALERQYEQFFYYLFNKLNVKRRLYPDFYNEMVIKLIKCMELYDIDREFAFISYLGRACTRRIIALKIKEARKDRVSFSWGGKTPDLYIELIESICIRETPLDQIIAQEEMEAMTSALERITPRYRKILLQKLEMTGKEVGKLNGGISRERVRQLCEKGKRELRNEIQYLEND